METSLIVVSCSKCGGPRLEDKILRYGGCRKCDKGGRTDKQFIDEMIATYRNDRQESKMARVTRLCFLLVLKKQRKRLKSQANARCWFCRRRKLVEHPGLGVLISPRYPPGLDWRFVTTSQCPFQGCEFSLCDAQHCQAVHAMQIHQKQ